MNRLNRWRVHMHHVLLQKTLKTLQVKRFSKPYSQIQTIGLFFDATELDARELVLTKAKQLKKNGKKVTLLGYFNNKLDNPNFTFPYFNRKDLDWAFRPSKKKEVIDFLHTEFDLLIVASEKTDYIPEYIGALSRAHMRVGPVTENTYAFDLMIDGGPNMRLSEYFQQAEKLLQLNDRQHEEASI